MQKEAALGSLNDADNDDTEDPELSLPAMDPAAVLATELTSPLPELAAKQAAYFDAQISLIGLQKEHLHEQRSLTLSHLRLRRVADWFRTSTQIYILIITILIGSYFVVMVCDAYNSQSVVVEAFEAPAALGSDGLTGKALASGLLDQLTLLRNATRSATPGLTVTGAWANDIKIEVPTTGISLGEVDRILRARLGRDLHISGELVQTQNAKFALRVRGDGIAPKSFPGFLGDLDKTVADAAEYIYGQSQPAKYTAYLDDVGRSTEAVAFAKAAFGRTPAANRPALLNAWGAAVGNSGGDPREALNLFEAEVKLKPDSWPGYANSMNCLIILGDEEGAWRLGQAMRQAAGGKPGRASEIDFQNYDQITWDMAAQRREFKNDADSAAGFGTGSSSSTTALAVIDALLHDPTDAELSLQTTRENAADPTIPAAGHFVHGFLALDRGDRAAAVAEMEAFGAAMKNPAVSSSYPGFDCWIAVAEEASGRHAQADAALNAVDAALVAAGSHGHFVDCARFHADIIDGRGDWLGAQRAYATAIAIAPDLPAAYYSWGLALTRHHDTDGASKAFVQASQRGPHWADPIKARADLLAQQGRWQTALALYNTALSFAPAWMDLQQARARALAQGN